jgi:hypothetical protein
VWNQVENARVTERRQLRRETLGEAAQELDAEEIVQRVVAGRIFVPVVLHTQQVGLRVPRFYDIDGRAGRQTYYEFWDRRDIEGGRIKDGAIPLRISPEALEKYVQSNPIVAEHFIFPAGFGVSPAKPARPRPARDANAPRQRQRRSTPRERSTDYLADVEEVI